MAVIKITSKLSSNEQRRLRRAADGFSGMYPAPAGAFMRADTPGEYHVIEDDNDEPARDPHSVARSMMVCAGTTFDYEVR